MATQTIEEFVAGYPRAGGFVYVLTSEAHPELLKIGFTTRSPGERAAELDATGSPHPFVVAFALYDAEPHKAERRLHAILAEYRVRSEREFFALPLTEAVAAILREFPETSGRYDPHALTTAGKARLEQFRAQSARLKSLEDRATSARERHEVAIKDKKLLEQKLMETSIRRMPTNKNSFRIDNKIVVANAAMEFRAEQFRKEALELNMRLRRLSTEREEAEEAYRAAGGDAVIREKLKAISSRYK